jgi:hypothetical protein
MTIAVPTSAPLTRFSIPITGMFGSIPKYVTATVNVAPAAPASIITPMPGALSAGQTQFTWNSGIGATQYILSVGSSAGATDIYPSTTTSAQSATMNLPSNIAAAYLTLQSLTPAGWLTQKYTYWLPTLPANSTGGLGSVTVHRSGPSYALTSPITNDTITGCSAPRGVTTSLGQSPQNSSIQTVTDAASSTAAFGATNVSCSTQGGMTVTAEVDIDGYGDQITDVETTWNGGGSYHIAIEG